MINVGFCIQPKNIYEEDASLVIFPESCEFSMDSKFMEAIVHTPGAATDENYPIEKKFEDIIKLLNYWVYRTNNDYTSEGAISLYWDIQHKIWQIIDSQGINYIGLYSYNNIDVENDIVLERPRLGYVEKIGICFGGNIREEFLAITYSPRRNQVIISVLATKQEQEPETPEEPNNIEIKVNKHWEDNDNELGYRPESIEVKLLANKEDTGKTITLSELNSWTNTFENLDDIENDEKIIYTIEEIEVYGYRTEIKGDAETGFEIINTQLPKEGWLKIKKTVEQQYEGLINR